jgi:hypothetical protein
MKIHLLILLAAVLLLLSACGTQAVDAPTSTVVPSDTQPPVPTSTPLPPTTAPTETPLPTPTVVPTSTPLPTPVGGGSGRIAFLQRAETTVENEPIVWNLMSVEVDGSGIKDLIEDELPGTIIDFRWSPTGDRILFTHGVRADSDQPYEFIHHIAAVDGGELEKVPPDGHSNLDALPIPEVLQEVDGYWSPDGTSIVLVSNRNNMDTQNNNSEVFIYNLQSQSLKQLTDRRIGDIYDSYTIWSPDGGSVAFVASELEGPDLIQGPAKIHIMSVDADVADVNASTTIDPQMDQISSLAWSPDGQKIAFESESDGDAEIFVVNVDGTGLQQLTNNEGFLDAYPQWSPDGSQIAFHSDRDGNTEIYVITIDGLVETRITDDPGSDSAAVWSPDGQWLAFSSDRDGDRDIFVMRLDGSEIRNLTQSRGQLDITPAWSP